MKATSSRRKLIVIVLLVLAATGAVLRLGADNPSLTRDVGNLLLVLWVPVIGNVVGFFRDKIKASTRLADFGPAAGFQGHLEVELTPLPAAAPTASPPRPPLPPDERRCALVLDTDGFTARLPLPLAQWLADGTAQAMRLELLKPALAGPRFPPGAVFHVLAGHSIVGTGRVLKVLHTA